MYMVRAHKNLIKNLWLKISKTYFVKIASRIKRYAVVKVEANRGLLLKNSMEDLEY